MKNKYKSGFTLIELLVVIGILAVLAAIAIPSIAGLIDRANVSADNTNANEMTNAIERFVSEYELYCQDIASGKLDTNNLDSAQGRVYNVTKVTDRDGISNIEKDKGDTISETGIFIYRDTKYPANVDTVRSVIENYTKTSSSTFEPKRSDCHFYYSPDCGIVVCTEVIENQTELINKLNSLIISGKDAKGNKLDEHTIWLDITYNNVVRLNTMYKSDFLQTDNGNFLVVAYTFHPEGGAYSSFKTYAPDKTTIIDEQNTSYSNGSFVYKEGIIKYDYINFAEIINDGKTIIQLDTSYGDVKLNIK